MSRLNFIQGEYVRLWNLCPCYVTRCYGAIRAMLSRVEFGGLARNRYLDSGKSALLVFARVCRRNSGTMTRFSRWPI